MYRFVVAARLYVDSIGCVGVGVFAQWSRVGLCFEKPTSKPSLPSWEKKQEVTPIIRPLRLLFVQRTPSAWTCSEVPIRGSEGRKRSGGRNEQVQGLRWLANISVRLRSIALRTQRTPKHPGTTPVLESKLWSSGCVHARLEWWYQLAGVSSVSGAEGFASFWYLDRTPLGECPLLALHFDFWVFYEGAKGNGNDSIWISGISRGISRRYNSHFNVWVLSERAKIPEMILNPKFAHF